MAASGRSRGGDATSATGSGDSDANAKRAFRRAVDTLAADIRADDRGVPAKRLWTTWIAAVGR